MNTFEEDFSDRRMRRCGDIARDIMANWQKSNALTYVVRATQPVAGLGLPDLRTHYFSVGVTEDNLTDIPFLDVLVIFSMIEKQVAAFKERAKRKERKRGKFKLRIEITTSFSDEEAAGLLSRMLIQTPFDKGKRLRIVATPKEQPAEDDDPQTQT